MTYTIISAKYANKESTAVTANTKEVAEVALSEIDTPEEWENLKNWEKSGNDISEYREPIN